MTSYGLKVMKQDEGKFIKRYHIYLRIATMSRMLNSFFSYWIKERLKEENIYYIVYAGLANFTTCSSGDKLIQKANEIRKEFYW